MLLGKTTSVFLGGKEHVEYRKGQNGLFTRQGLSRYLSLPSASSTSILRTPGLRAANHMLTSRAPGVRELLFHGLPLLTGT